ncbi:MAG: cation-translocating P-type ATPase [Clostridia bacterium]|nr:cation-translocating P-type ATPase [Clostridia bacterium]
MEQKIERFNPEIDIGLTDEQIRNRIEQNLVNYDSSVPTKSFKQIIFDNFFTLFNFLNLILGIAIFAVGSYKNMLFLGIMIINTAISTFQEIHSKKIVDKLAIMAQSKVKVLRNGKEQEIPINDLVLDDIVIFNTGSQIPTDCIILKGNVLSNESFITGEPDSITKVEGEILLSGSYIVGGKCYAKVEHIGEENYTAQISSGAKYVKKINSEIMKSLNKIIKWLTFAIIPIGALLFWNQINLDGATLKDAVVQSVAAVIGMIPEGLVLLTSTVLAVSVIRLSRSKVLVQELYCIETLARVDTLCLDKTGTLTEGRMEVSGLIGVKNGILEEADFFENESNINNSDITNILANIAKSSEDENPTMQAIKAKFSNLITNEFEVKEKVAFSSKTKWSGITFKNEGSYILGAPEFILKENFEKYKNNIQKYTENYRVLVIAHSNNKFVNNTESENSVLVQKELPAEIVSLGFVLISDVIRKEASKTLEYFRKQDVDIKIISGDNPITVSKIAKQVGVENADKYIDMSTLNTEEEIEKAALNYTIFGRVSPTQKKDLVTALQKHGKTVAMTGDGVNDVLALKTADCSIAMANGSDATKNVSQLILLDSNFASMPKVVGEGRRTINNIERSASLFLVKTIYSSTLALLFLFLSQGYPFEPIHLSLISVVTIGIPSFMLALEPNNDRIRGNFLKNVISKAIPTAITTIISILVIAFALKLGHIPQSAYSTLCVIATGISGFSLLFTLSKSRKSEKSKLLVSPYRFVLALIMVGLFIVGLTFLNWWFNIVELVPILKYIGSIAVLTTVDFIVLKFIFRKIFKI